MKQCDLAVKKVPTKLVLQSVVIVLISLFPLKGHFKYICNKDYYMKFIVSSAYLLKQIQVLGGVINNSNTLPILDNFLFSLDGNSTIGVGL